MYALDLTTVLDRYAEARSTADADHRWSLVHDCVVDDVVHVDPASPDPVEGQAALASTLGVRPEAFAFTDEPDAHHGWIRVPWRSIGDAVTTGVMIASLARDGRLAYVLHFVDPD